MLRNRNISAQRIEGGGSAGLTAASFRLPMGNVVATTSAGAVSYVRHCSFNVNVKGAGGTATSFTMDIQKNGTSVLASVITVTIGTVSNYSKADTDKTIAATAPTGWDQLPALSATAANLKCAEGDAIEIVITPNGTTTTGPQVSCSVTLERQ